MNGLGRTAILTMVSLLFLVTQAHALSITFGGAPAQQYDVTTNAMVNAGLTSARSGIYAATNTADTASGWFIETFDNTDGTGGFTTLDADQLTVTDGAYDFKKGSAGYAATPANDETFFAFAPAQTGDLPAEVIVPLTAFKAYEPGLFIDYMGLYFGSIDTYNFIDFYFMKDDGFVQRTLTGTEILQKLNGTSGDQFDIHSNVYVNLDFDLPGGEIFAAFALRTTGRALEIDNIVAHVTTAPVPEPSTFILLGAGFLGLAALGRKRFAQ